MTGARLIENTSKASLQPCYQKLQKISANVAQLGPKSDPRGPQNDVKIRPQLQKHRNKTHLKTSKKQYENQSKFNRKPNPETLDGGRKIEGFGGPISR